MLVTDSQGGCWERERAKLPGTYIVAYSGTIEFQIIFLRIYLVTRGRYYGYMLPFPNIYSLWNGLPIRCSPQANSNSTVVPMGLGIINHRRKSQSTLKMLIVIIVLKMLILIPQKCHTDTCWMDFSGKVIFGLGLNNVLKHHQRKFSNQDMVSMYRYLRAIMLELSPNCQIG